MGLFGSKSSSIKTPDYGNTEAGLNFGTSGTWPNGNRNIEGMSTEPVKRNVQQIGANSQRQFDLGAALLQPQFDKSRSKVSQALSSRGMGRTSTFANSMTDIAGKEQMAQSSLMSNLIKSEQSDALSRSQLGANMEMAGLSSRDKRAGFRYGLAGQQMSAQASKDSAKSGMLGKGIGAVATGGMNLLDNK